MFSPSPAHFTLIVGFFHASFPPSLPSRVAKKKCKTRITRFSLILPLSQERRGNFSHPSLFFPFPTPRTSAYGRKGTKEGRKEREGRGVGSLKFMHLRWHRGGKSKQTYLIRSQPPNQLSEGTRSMQARTCGLIRRWRQLSHSIFYRVCVCELTIGHPNDEEGRGRREREREALNLLPLLLD